MALPYAFPYVCQCLVQHNVEIIRGYEGAARAPHATCPRRTSDAIIGSTGMAPRSPVCGIGPGKSRTRIT
jgi:hypothetical protein